MRQAINIFDYKSIGLYGCTLMLNAWNSVSMDDFSNLFTSLAALTTVGYNVYKYYKMKK